MDQRLQDPAGAVPPDWRGLCEELVRELECWRPLTEVPDCLARARAALAAEADGPAVRRREPASVIGEPSDEEIMELMPQRMRDDLAAAVRAMAEQEGKETFSIAALRHRWQIRDQFLAIAVELEGTTRDPLEPNDLSHLSDEEFKALAPQGYHGL